MGSDVVWDYEDKRLGQDGVYFGDFREQYTGKIVSYAASAGTVDGKRLSPDWVCNGLKGFDAITVRDNNTASMVEMATGKRP